MNGVKSEGYGKTVDEALKAVSAADMERRRRGGKD
jgi:hypothetical protein